MWNFFLPPLSLDYLKANTTFNMHLPSSQLHCHNAPPTRAWKRLYTIFHFSSLSLFFCFPRAQCPQAQCLLAGSRWDTTLLFWDDYKAQEWSYSDKSQYKNSCPLTEKWNINSRRLLWFNILNYIWMTHFPMCLWHSSKIT